MRVTPGVSFSRGNTHNTCYTDYVANLTLTIDDDLLKRARMTALRRDTSVNALVREFLTDIAAEDQQQEAVRALLESARRNPGNSRGWKWNREEIYEERLGRYGPDLDEAG